MFGSETRGAGLKGVLMRRSVRWPLGGIVVLFVLLQLVPYGRDHANPPVRQEPAWDAPRTRELAGRACFDCHSNQTLWPWYASVAPSETSPVVLPLGPTVF